MLSNNILSTHYDQFPNDHELLFYSYNLNLNDVRTKLIQYRDFKAIDLVSQYQDSLCVTWNEAYLYTDVNDKLTCFLDYVRNLFEKHVPLKIIKIKNSKPSWFNHDEISLLRIGNPTKKYAM